MELGALIWSYTHSEGPPIVLHFFSFNETDSLNLLFGPISRSVFLSSRSPWKRLPAVFHFIPLDACLVAWPKPEVVNTSGAMNCMKMNECIKMHSPVAAQQLHGGHHIEASPLWEWVSDGWNRNRTGKRRSLLAEYRCGTQSCSFISWLLEWMISIPQ